MTTHQHNKAKVMILAVLIMLWGILHAENVSSGSYSDTAHGNSTSGVDRSCIDGVGAPYSTVMPKGYCTHCHEPRSTLGGVEPLPPGACDAPFNLFMNNYGANKNDLCYACHETFEFGYGLGYGRYGIYQGKINYTASVHNTENTMLWPGSSPPGPALADYGNCRNCHNPHGDDDGSGLIPHMLFQRDGQAGNEMGCEACHDGGQAAKDIKSELNKTYTHPTHTYNDRHSLPEGENSSFDENNRHAECVDCHNPHTIGGIAATPTVHGTYFTPDRTSNGNLIYDTTFGSAALQGVWGVDVSSWPAMWERPTSFTELRPPNNPEYAEKEYQICFKCHSYYADHDATGDTYRVARDFNPNNKSGHPILMNTDNQPGSEYSYGAVTGLPYRKGLRPEALKDPWKENAGNNTMYCSDCHGNDVAVGPVGVHGSERANMLRSFAGGENIYWPNKPDGSPWTLGGWDYDQYLFCAGCHTMGSGDPLSWDSVHWGADGWHAGEACTTCHQRSMHGGQKSRLVAVDGAVVSFTKLWPESNEYGQWYWYGGGTDCDASGCTWH